MSKISHYTYLSVMSAIVFVSFVFLVYKGLDYYQVGIEDRFYHEDHTALKPSGSWGHGYGIIGSFLMAFGVTIYMMRKRMRSLSKLGQIKHWLEFHIFLCTLGPILVLFHTAMKFGGIVSISFWSMVAVFASGIIGRFIYIQIPRTIEGRELSLNELNDSKSNISDLLKADFNLGEDTHQLIINSIQERHQYDNENVLSRFFKKYSQDRRNLKKIKSQLKKYSISSKQKKQLIKNINDEIILNRRIDRLNVMKNLFKYWHVAHLPFAIIMLAIMIVHVVVTLLFGYKWIF